MRSVLLICCLALAAVIGYELEHPFEPLPGQQSVRPQSDRAPKPITVPTLSFPPPSAYREVAARPLFLASRRPPADDGVRALAVQDPLPQYLLSGVSISPAGALAILWDKRKRKFIRASVGEELDGWRLESVKADQITLRRQGKSLNLEIKWGGNGEGPVSSPLTAAEGEREPSTTLNNTGPNAKGEPGSQKKGAERNTLGSENHASQPSQGSRDSDDQGR